MREGEALDSTSLLSEGRNPQTLDIDLLPVGDILSLMNREDRLVADAVARELPQIERAVARTEQAFADGGRLIYVGAGTSGRLGVLDASECPPTFSVAPTQVIGIIAGGEPALRQAVERAEDDEAQGARDLQAVAVNRCDVVVGIAVSGRTPYVIGALAHAREMGATTVALTCNPGSVITRQVDIAIAPQVGPEVISGSTRLKSGTAQKMVLNMLSTAAMIRSGKTYSNLMVDVTVSNRKLAERAVGIVREATGCGADEARALLNQGGGSVKLAILMQLTGFDAPKAREALLREGGFLRNAIDNHNGDAQHSAMEGDPS